MSPSRVGRIARPVVPALVERQEPRRLALQLRAESHLAVVHGEMDHAAAELEQQLARVAVLLVLLDGVLDRLLGQAVFQLERGDGQAVDEQARVEGKLRLVAAVAELAGDAETVLGEPLGRLGVAGRGRAVEQVDMVRAVLDAVPQHVDDAPLGDLALEPGQELLPRRAGVRQVEMVDQVGLRGGQKRGELRQVDGEFAVVLLGVALNPAGGGHVGDDQALQALFAGVGLHGLESAMGTLRGQFIERISGKNACPWTSHRLFQISPGNNVELCSMTRAVQAWALAKGSSAPDPISAAFRKPR